MLQLILFRHGKAEPAQPGIEDHARALAPRGWDDAPRVMRTLLSRGMGPEIVLCSDARRCRETREALEDMLSGTPVSARPDLYLAESDAVLNIAKQEASINCVSSVLVIGHNPGLHFLASQLAPIGDAAATSLRQKFPTGSAACFRRQSTDDPWELSAFVRPSDFPQGREHRRL